MIRRREIRGHASGHGPAPRERSRREGRNSVRQDRQRPAPHSDDAAGGDLVGPRRKTPPGRLAEVALIGGKNALQAVA